MGCRGGMWRERFPAHRVNTDLAAKLDYHAGLLRHADQHVSSIQEQGGVAHEFCLLMSFPWRYRHLDGDTAR